MITNSFENYLENEFNVVKKNEEVGFFYFATRTNSKEKEWVMELNDFVGLKMKGRHFFPVFSKSFRFLICCFQKEAYSLMIERTGNKIRIVNAENLAKKDINFSKIKPIAMKNEKVLLYDSKKKEIFVRLFRNLEWEKEKRTYTIQKNKRIEQLSWTKNEENLVISLNNFEIIVLDKALNLQRKFLYSCFGNIIGLKPANQKNSCFGVAIHERLTLGFNINKDVFKLKPKKNIFKNGSLLLFEEEEAEESNKKSYFFEFSVLENNAVEFERIKEIGITKPNMFYFSEIHNLSLICNKTGKEINFVVFDTLNFDILDTVQLGKLEQEEVLLGCKIDELNPQKVIFLIGTKLKDERVFFSEPISKIIQTRKVKMKIKKRKDQIITKNELSSKKKKIVEKKQHNLEKRIEDLEENQIITNQKLGNLENMLVNQTKILESLLKLQQNNK